MADREHHQIARRLRRRATAAERSLWRLLRDRATDGFKFRRQHPVERYVLDFYCPEACLALEVDGSHHDAPDQGSYDAIRTRYLDALGIRVVRFSNQQVLDDPDSVVQAIEHLLERKP